VSRKARGSAVAPEVGKYLGLGLTWALSTVLFLWLGSLADGWLGTEPWLTLAGAFIGAGAGFYSMVHQLSAASRGRGDEGDERAREERQSRERE
jgi:F0F1-type ATP synthase assembly protein I